MRTTDSSADDELLRVAVERGVGRRFPQRDRLDASREFEILVGDAAGRMGLEFDPELPPSDGEIRMMPRLLGKIADGIDEQERNRPAAGIEFPAQPAVFELPCAKAEFGDLGGDLGFAVDVRFVFGHGNCPPLHWYRSSALMQGAADARRTRATFGTLQIPGGRLR